MVRANRQTNWAYFIAGQSGPIPVCIGGPGAGKSEITEALAKVTGRVYRNYLLSTIMPEDIGGFPVVAEVHMPDGQTVKVMSRVFEETLVRCFHEPSILHFDELTNVGHATQAAVLTLFQRRIPNTWIFASGNPIELAASGCDLTRPMVNRLCVLDWEDERANMLAGWENNGEYPVPQFPLLADGWEAYCEKWYALGKAFIETLPELLCAYPKNDAAPFQAYPTPRSWSNVWRLLGAAESVGASIVTQKKLVAGCVGDPACKAFYAYRDEQALPDPEDILKDPKSLDFSKFGRGDLAIAVLKSVLNAVRQDNSPERWEQARKVQLVAAKQRPEAARGWLGQLNKVKPDGYEPKATVKV